MDTVEVSSRIARSTPRHAHIRVPPATTEAGRELRALRLAVLSLGLTTARDANRLFATARAQLPQLCLPPVAPATVRHYLFDTCRDSKARMDTLAPLAQLTAASVAVVVRRSFPTATTDCGQAVLRWYRNLPLSAYDQRRLNQAIQALDIVVAPDAAIAVDEHRLAFRGHVTHFRDRTCSLSA